MFVCLWKIILKIQSGISDWGAQAVKTNTSFETQIWDPVVYSCSKLSTTTNLKEEARWLKITINKISGHLSLLPSQRKDQLGSKHQGQFQIKTLTQAGKSPVRGFHTAPCCHLVTDNFKIISENKLMSYHANVHVFGRCHLTSGGVRPQF